LNALVQTLLSASVLEGTWGWVLDFNFCFKKYNF